MADKALATFNTEDSFGRVLSTVASTAKQADNINSELKIKHQGENIKSQSPVMKKKAQDSEATLVSTADHDLPPETQLTSHMVVVQPPIPESSTSSVTQSSEQNEGDSSTSVLSSSASSSLCFVPLTTALSGASSSDNSVEEAGAPEPLRKADGGTQTVGLATTGTTSQGMGNANLIGPPPAVLTGSSSKPLVATTVPAVSQPTGSSQRLPQKIAGDNPPIDVLAAKDAPRAEESSSGTNPAASALQQQGAAILQVADTGVSQVSDVPSATLKAGWANEKTQLSEGKAAGSFQAATDRQIAAPKLKSGFSASPAIGGVEGSGEFDDHSDNVSSVLAGAMSKPSGVTETVAQEANVSKTTSYVADLQQGSNSAAVASPIPEVSQPTTTNAQPALHGVPGQAPPDNAAVQALNSAQLIQSMHSSEMKLGMQSAEFGNISITTSLSHQTLSAQISLDHSELSRALAVHLPAIEEKLGSAYGMQAKVELRDSNMPSSSGDSGYHDSGQQSKQQGQSSGGRTYASQDLILHQVGERSTFPPSTLATTVSRLDIRI